MRNKLDSFEAAIVSGVLLFSSGAFAVEISASTGLTARVDEKSGVYEVRSTNPAWDFCGSVGSALQHMDISGGRDGAGHYQQISFKWRDGKLPMAGEIRLYEDKPLALFSDKCGAATVMPPAPFPSFTNLPGNLHLFSYGQKAFAPPEFAASECSTPWLLFDDQADALVISPASHYMVARMIGDGQKHLASGFNSDLRNLPKGFTQQTLLAFGNGINRTWELWGGALTGLEGVKRPGNEADTILKYFGYWTDNGAVYYYNYDFDKGYAGTLQALVEHYRQEQIPIGYLQLDSWWYYKTLTSPEGETGKPKSEKLPEGAWNRYGGLLEYKAHPYLFSNGLAAFQKSIGLPMVTHNRWIDLASPYHQNYKISGVAAVDPRWWNDIIGYINSCGVVTYEQDWLDRIYKNSPEFSSTVNTADEFLDDMAAACQKKGLTMQYCMPYPCYFLQGSRYENLTTIRTSGDRFKPEHWYNFLFTSRLASALGIWPWADVFMSTETNNLILATLSAGPVGVGDAIGAEDKNNLFKSFRADGVIVKPDASIVPLDSCYLAEAQHSAMPVIAATYTLHDGMKTEYVFAFKNKTNGEGRVSFTPAELGFNKPVYAYDYYSGEGRHLAPEETYSSDLGDNRAAYYIVAPVGDSGIAFIGDMNKFVSTGKNRIVSLEDEGGSLTAKVVFAPMENTVTLHGYAAVVPSVSVQGGQAGQVAFDAASNHFSVQISPDTTEQLVSVGGDPVREVTVEFQTGAKSADKDKN